MIDLDNSSTRKGQPPTGNMETNIELSKKYPPQNTVKMRWLLTAAGIIIIAIIIFLLVRANSPTGSNEQSATGKHGQKNGDNMAVPVTVATAKKRYLAFRNSQYWQCRIIFSC